MMKKTHVVVGITLSTIVATILNKNITLIYIIASFIGSLFPDVDHPRGSINQRILLVNNWICKVLTYLMLAAILYIYGSKALDIKTIYYTIPFLIGIAFSRHRSITHSILGILASMVLINFIKLKYNLDLRDPFFVGYISHILLDMFNPQGVELLWPYRKRIKFPLTVETGGMGEKIVCYIILVIEILFLLKKGGM
ncbi:metal-dependent hydrolase [Clostridium hydrogeniformans]|uniref:metal-dependent hydrolase n=1 Tax=Clostridium hydrogeniformans TaxID=349933 RepID=UPI000482347A|nr:metal-dependent hydrolase [Clostridium hydrogeniformans]